MLNKPASLSWDDLLQYQNRTIDYLYENTHAFIIAPMSSGKTVIALSALAALNLPDDKGVVHVRKGLLITTPTIAANVWPVERDKWSQLQTLNLTTILGASKKRDTKMAAFLNDNSQTLGLCGLYTLKWLKLALKSLPNDHPVFDLLIVDETSFFGDALSQRSQLLMELAKRFRNVWGLTGTPCPKNYLNYFVSHSLMTRQREWGYSFFEWRNRFFRNTPHGRFPSWVLRSGSQAIIDKAVARHTLKIDSSHIKKPPVTDLYHTVTLPKHALKAYDKIKKQLLYFRGSPLAKMWQIAQGFQYAQDATDTLSDAEILHKVKIEMLESLLAGSEGLSSLIVYWFKGDIHLIKKAKLDIVFLQDFNGRNKSKVIEGWNSGRITRLAIHPLSAGHGLNLQGVPAQIIHYALNWSSESYDQVIARVARQGYAGGTDTPILNHHIIANDTLDMTMYKRAHQKIKTQKENVEKLPCAHV